MTSPWHKSLYISKICKSCHDTYTSTELFYYKMLQILNQIKTWVVVEERVKVCTWQVWPILNQRMAQKATPFRQTILSGTILCTKHFPNCENTDTSVTTGELTSVLWICTSPCSVKNIFKGIVHVR